MYDELRTFVLLKYEILTSNPDTWKRCEATYPASVKQKWAASCASDVEHHAKGYPDAEECIRIAKLYRNGAATLEELEKARSRASGNLEGASAESAAAAYYAAGAFQVAAAAYYAAAAAAAADVAYYFSTIQEDMWKLYISWLIEELCEYELQIGGGSSDTQLLA